MRKQIFDIIEPQQDSILSRVYDYFMLVMIIISLIPLAFREDYRCFEWFDKISVSVFIVDYLLRWMTADGRQAVFSAFPARRYRLIHWDVF